MRTNLMNYALYDFFSVIVIYEPLVIFLTFDIKMIPWHSYISLLTATSSFIYICTLPHYKTFIVNIKINTKHVKDKKGSHQNIIRSNVVYDHIGILSN